MGGDGGLAGGNRGWRASGARGAAGEGDTETPDRCGNPHVTAYGIGGGLRMCVGDLSMEGTLGCGLRSIFTEGRREWPWQFGSKVNAKALTGVAGSDRGVRGSVRTEAFGRNAEGQSAESAEADRAS